MSWKIHVHVHVAPNFKLAELASKFHFLWLIKFYTPYATIWVRGNANYTCTCMYVFIHLYMYILLLLLFFIWIEFRFKGFAPVRFCYSQRRYEQDWQDPRWGPIRRRSHTSTDIHGNPCLGRQPPSPHCYYQRDTGSCSRTCTYAFVGGTSV